MQVRQWPGLFLKLPVCVCVGTMQSPASITCPGVVATIGRNRNHYELSAVSCENTTLETRHQIEVTFAGSLFVVSDLVHIAIASAAARTITQPVMNPVASVATPGVESGR